MPALHPYFDPTLLAEASQERAQDQLTQHDCALQARLANLETLGWVLNQKVDTLAQAIDLLILKLHVA